MADKRNHDEHLERIMNQLADSMLGLSDEAILAEVRGAGCDPDDEAERTRMVLRKAARALEDVNRTLSNLGHMVDSSHWRREHGVYHNKCLNCGSLVSFTTATGEMQGKAVDAPCPESGQYTIPRREASRG
jgi:predicted RNA-binding Zn-ribbon protein involved in translation (DUF1610 family)